MAAGIAVVLDIVLGPAEIAPASCQPLQAAWSSLVYGLLYTTRWRLVGLAARVLHAPAVAGRAAAPDPLVGVRACTLGGPGDTWRSRTP